MLPPLVVLCHFPGPEQAPKLLVRMPSLLNIFIIIFWSYVLEKGGGELTEFTSDFIRFRPSIIPFDRQKLHQDPGMARINQPQPVV